MSETRGYRKPRRKFDIPERVAERAATRYVVDEAGCWISTYSVASHGYAQIGWQDRDFRQIVTAHRASWVHFHGQIPEGMTIDHTCKQRRCVNPAHLRVLSNYENARRTLGRDWPLGQCVNGHPSSETYQRPSGKRICRSCNEAAQARYRAKQRAKAA